jgi:hypothetical protein
MRQALPENLERSRKPDYFGPDIGRNGRFQLQGPCGALLTIHSDDGAETGWEHVWVATDRRRSPNWPEMCFVKDLFWDEEERVMQLHPPLSEYVKMHPYCLHLWKPKEGSIPAPPASLVGIVGIGPEEAQAYADQAVSQIMEYVAQAVQRDEFGGS